MCTVTAMVAVDKLIVTMNRDEARQRAESGLYLGRDDTAAVSKVYPIDAVSQGTWMGTNNNGVVLCLLNRYHEQLGVYSASRGRLIPYLLGLGCAASIKAQFEGWINSGSDLSPYAPFDLLLFSHELSAQVTWNGEEGALNAIDCNKPFCQTSSSVSTQAVIMHRKNLFETCTDEDLLKVFHLNQDATDKSSSVLMDREKSHTKSVSQVVLGVDSSVFKYTSHENLDRLVELRRFNEDNSDSVRLDLK